MFCDAIRGATDLATVVVELFLLTVVKIPW